ncbi:MAG: lipopolysaccharide biosynthesis protein [bacterium]|nr:lipopolysaccharide biosynthesis protein [bacterium]
MKRFTNWMIGSACENPEQRDMIWNMIGSFLYAFASMVLSIAVIQIVGEREGGIFTFAFSTFGQHMFMVAYFGIRPFQITDMGKRYTFGDYLGLRLLTCAAALLFGLGYVALHDYTREKAMVVFLMVCYKVIDALADTYEAEFQRSGRLYLTGKSNAFRTLLSVSLFLTSLTLTKNLMAASLVAVAAQILGLLLFDVAIIHGLLEIDWTSQWRAKWGLLRDNSLLFFSVVLDFYIFSASKYAIEEHMLDKDLAVYGAIFMPTSVINLVAGFVIRPYLTRMSMAWEDRDLSYFVRLIRKQALVIVGLTVLAVGGAWFLGIPVLGLVYSNIRYALQECRFPLVCIILGGALNAFMNLFYYVLIIMKKQRFIFLLYGAVALLALWMSPLFVKQSGILGASLSYMILMGVLMLGFFLHAAYFFVKEKRG